MARVELKNIIKRFGDNTALDDVSFSIQDGQFFCLLGSSGAGKSTTINIISGVELPDAGKILLNDKDITGFLPQERNIATAFESYALYPHFTVYQNLMFPLEAPGRKHTLTLKEKDGLVHRTASMLGIEELLHRYPRELSGGQRQRVALGRTLVRRPNIYLLDEPIAHLDAKLRHRMRSELKKIQQELGITTLYTTPDQLEALSMGDVIAVLNKGKIEQIGTSDEIYYKPVNMYVARFVGDPPINFFKAVYKGTHFVIENESNFQIPVHPNSKAQLDRNMKEHPIFIGIRPKDITTVSPQDRQAHLRGEVVLIDTLGQTSVITVKEHSHIVKVKINTDKLPNLHAIVGLQFDNLKLYYFDAESRERLG